MAHTLFGRSAFSDLDDDAEWLQKASDMHNRLINTSAGMRGSCGGDFYGCLFVLIFVL